MSMRRRRRLRGGGSLFRIAAGDSLSALGASFTRSTTATYTDASGIVQTAAINAVRDGHFIGGVRTTLLEGSRTNSQIQSSDFSNVAYAPVAATVTANATTAPDGTVTAAKLAEDGTTAAHLISPAAVWTGAFSTAQSFSFFAKAAERSWVGFQSRDVGAGFLSSWVNLATGAKGTIAGGHTVTVTPHGNSWYRIAVSFTNPGAGASTNNWFVFPSTGDGVSSYTGTVGNGVYLWGGQRETDQPFASSYIPTTTVAVTRGADLFWVPFLPPPQALTIYAKSINLGTWQVGAAGSPSLYNISDPAARLSLYNGGALLGPRSLFHNGTTQLISAGTLTNPSLSDTVETRQLLNADGSTAITESVNAGAESTSSTTTTNALPAAFGEQRLYLNGDGVVFSQGFVALIALKIATGARALAEMQAF